MAHEGSKAFIPPINPLNPIPFESIEPDISIDPDVALEVVDEIEDYDENKPSVNNQNLNIYIYTATLRCNKTIHHQYTKLI